MKVSISRIPFFLLGISLIFVWNCGCPENDGSSPKPPPETVNVGNTPDPGINQATAPSQIPQVKIETTMGDIVVELYPEAAPLTVKNFLRYVDEGFYEGTIFHRVIADQMIQGGGIEVDLSVKSPHEAVPYEADNGLSNTRGTLAMARNVHQPDSATSMFFINKRDSGYVLDHGHPPIPDEPGIDEYGYTVFGRVLEGMDVVDRINESPTTDAGTIFTFLPIVPVVITKVSVLN